MRGRRSFGYITKPCQTCSIRGNPRSDQGPGNFCGPVVFLGNGDPPRFRPSIRERTRVNPQDLLIIFIALQIVHHLVEVALSWLNKNWYSDPVRQREAAAALQIPPADMEKTLAYSLDKYKFSITWGTLNSLIILTFIAAGGLGWLESVSAGLVAPLGGGPVVTGLAFFALAGLASGLLDLPGEIWNTFGIEEKHGFNRQTPGGFISDRLKGLVLAAVLGGLLLSLILWVMEHMGQHWWIMAWLLLGEDLGVLQGLIRSGCDGRLDIGFQAIQLLFRRDLPLQ